MNKNFKIVRGKFTDLGNFTGRTKLGNVRVHIPSSVLETMEWTDEDEIKQHLPFFVCTEIQTISQLTENPETKKMEPTGVTNERLTATSIFLTEDDLAGAYVEEGMVDETIAEKVKEIGKSQKLDSKAIERLQQAVF